MTQDIKIASVAVPQGHSRPYQGTAQSKSVLKQSKMPVLLMVMAAGQMACADAAVTAGQGASSVLHAPRV